MTYFNITGGKSSNISCFLFTFPSYCCQHVTKRIVQRTWDWTVWNLIPTADHMYHWCHIPSCLTLRKKATIHHVITMLATSKNVLFPCHNHLLTTGTDNPFPSRRSNDNQSVGLSVSVVSRWLWPGNRTFSEMANVVVTWWIVFFWRSVSSPRNDGHLLEQKLWPEWLKLPDTCMICPLYFLGGNKIAQACISIVLYRLNHLSTYFSGVNLFSVVVNSILLLFFWCWPTVFSLALALRQ